jgi:leucyl-tRNA synthetase
MGGYQINNMREQDSGEQLKLIKAFIESELRFKQELIARQQHEIDHLRRKEEEDKALAKALEQKLLKSIAQNEGNKQLINKLLGDISKLQNDVEWYKRTYEQRSFLGVLKEKIKIFFR